MRPEPRATSVPTGGRRRQLPTDYEKHTADVGGEFCTHTRATSSEGGRGTPPDEEEGPLVWWATATQAPGFAVPSGSPWDPTEMSGRGHVNVACASLPLV